MFDSHVNMLARRSGSRKRHNLKFPWLRCRSKDDILAQIRDLQSEMARIESRNSTNKSN